MSDEAGGIQLIRQTFGNLLPQGYSVAQAYMRYEHEHDVEWQVLEFNVIGPDGKPVKFMSERVPARENVNELAAKTARQFLARVEEQKNEPPSGIDAPPSGQ